VHKRGTIFKFNQIQIKVGQNVCFTFTPKEVVSVRG